MEKESWKKAGYGEGVPGRVFQKPVKVFPFANTKFAALWRAACQHSHMQSLQHITAATLI